MIQKIDEHQTNSIVVSHNSPPGYCVQNWTLLHMHVDDDRRIRSPCHTNGRWSRLCTVALMGHAYKYIRFIPRLAFSNNQTFPIWYLIRLWNIHLYVRDTDLTALALLCSSKPFLWNYWNLLFVIFCMEALVSSQLLEFDICNNCRTVFM